MISHKDAKARSWIVNPNCAFVTCIFSSILNAALLYLCVLLGLKPNGTIGSIATGFIPVVRNIINHKDAKTKR